MPERRPPTVENLPQNIASLPWVKESPVKSIPDGDWITEPLWEGPRARIFIPKKDYPTIWTQFDGDVTHLFPDIAAQFKHFSRYHTALLEGFIHRYRQTGKNVVQERSKSLVLENPSLLIPAHLCTFIPNELLFIDGKIFTEQGSLMRKQKLERAITQYMTRAFDLHPNEWYTQDPELVLEIAKAQGFKGLILKGKNDGYNRRARWRRLEFHQY